MTLESRTNSFKCRLRAACGRKELLDKPQWTHVSSAHQITALHLTLGFIFPSRLNRRNNRELFFISVGFYLLTTGVRLCYPNDLVSIPRARRPSADNWTFSFYETAEIKKEVITEKQEKSRAD